MVKVYYTVKHEDAKRKLLWDHQAQFDTMKDAMRFITSIKCGGKKGYVLVGKPILEHV